MSTDLSALTTAADRWDGMAAEFEKQGKAYGREVHGIAMGRTWTGLSAEAASARFTITLREFHHARTEARAVASLLRDAHTQFTALRARLRTACAEAVAAGLRVSERGLVTTDRTDHPEPVVRSWQNRIDKVVREMTDADTGVHIALAAVTVDSDVMAGGKGFNGAALGDIERYEARAAEDTLAKLSRGGHLSDTELTELERTFRDNSDDEAFSRTVLDDLGPTGTIRLTNELNDLVHIRPGHDAQRYATLETGLADALATATRKTNSRWYRHWRTGMRHAGVAHYATDAQGARLDKAVGYQSLVTLVRRGRGYGRGVLEDLTDDMIAAEMRDPGIWRLKGAYAGRHEGWFANDPVDGMLGIMSRDPATAAHYLSDESHMKYLMKDRDWNVTLHDHGGEKAGGYAPTLDTDNRAGLGAALQAAATGIDPSDRHAHYVPHTKQNDAVLKSAISYLSDQGDDFPPALRRPMANILVNHGSTVHASMSEIDIAKSPLKQDELFEVTKQISKDKDAYATLNGGLNHSLVSAIHQDPSHSTEPLIRVGRTVGFLEEARIQSEGDPKQATFETKPLIDKAISYIPVVSGDVQEGFDYVTGKWMEDEQRRLDEGQADANIKSYSRRNGQLMALAEEWKRVHRGFQDPYFNPKEEISRSARDGSAHATGVSGERLQ
ncbi:hypothetical protein [Streptomyces anandii]|uniref:hypothetical protein n=1 Tax=Streptomyces anandii TaxID=285454 RepID=UPI001E592238|nr:hypothetical protein [Streptomyces anandii]